MHEWLNLDDISKIVSFSQLLAFLIAMIICIGSSSCSQIVDPFFNNPVPDDILHTSVKLNERRPHASELVVRWQHCGVHCSRQVFLTRMSGISARTRVPRRMSFNVIAPLLFTGHVLDLEKLTNYTQKKSEWDKLKRETHLPSLVFWLLFSPLRSIIAARARFISHGQRLEKVGRRYEVLTFDYFRCL